MAVLLAPSEEGAILRRWALMKRVSIGKKSYVGYALFVDVVNGCPAFVIEGRGPEVHRLRCEYTFIPGRGSQRFSRKQAFARARDLWFRLQSAAHSKQS